MIPIAASYTVGLVLVGSTSSNRSSFSAHQLLDSDNIVARAVTKWLSIDDVLALMNAIVAVMGVIAVMIGYFSLLAGMINIFKGPIMLLFFTALVFYIACFAIPLLSIVPVMILWLWAAAFFA